MRIIISILLVPVCLLSKSQTATSGNDCERMLKEAFTFSNSGQYESAIKKLNALSIHCPALSDTVTARLLKIYTDINLAKDNEKKAKENEGIEKGKAIAQARISEAGGFAAEALSILNFYPASLALSADKAVRSMKLDPSIHGDKVLRKVLEILAPLQTSVFVDIDPTHIAKNGEWLAIGGFHAKGMNEAIAIVNINTRKIVKFIEYDNHTIADIAITTNGKLVAVAMSEAMGPSYKVEIFNTTDWSSKVIATGPGYFGKMTFSNQCNSLIYYVPGGPIHVYDVMSKNLHDLHIRLRIDMMDIKEIQLVKNDQFIAIRSDNCLAVWEDWKLDNPALVFTEEFDSGKYIQFREIPFSFSSDGSYMAIAVRDSLNIISLPSFKLKKVNYVPGIQAVQFCAKSNNLLSFSKNGDFNYWDSTGKSIGNMNAGSDRLLDNRIILADNIKNFITTKRDDGKTVSCASFWDMQSGKETARLYHDSYIMAVYPLDRGTSAISIGKDREVRFWDDILAKETAFSTPRNITGFALNKERTILAIAAGGTSLHDYGITVIDLISNNVIQKIKNTLPIQQIRFSYHNKDILILTKRGLEIWKNWESSAPENQVLYEIPLQERQTTSTMGFNKKGNVAAICNGKGKIYVLYGPIWKSVKVVSYYNPVSHSGLDPRKSDLNLSFSGRYIAVGLTEGIAIVDVKNSKQINFISQDYHVDKIIFTPDEKKIIFASGIKPKENHKNPSWEILCIDIANPGKKIHIPFGELYIGAIAVSKDGSMLAVGLGRLSRIYKFPDKPTGPFKLISEIVREQTIRICDFTDDSRYIVSCFNDFLSGDRICFSLLQPADLIKEVEARLGNTR